MHYIVYIKHYCSLLFSGDIPAHLYGRTKFGCSAEDEWFVVHLLRELSAEHSDLVIRWVFSQFIYIYFFIHKRRKRTRSIRFFCVNCISSKVLRDPS